MKLRALLGGIAFCACLIGAAPASADAIDYTISGGTFDDGTAFGGTFSFDTDTNAVTNFDIVTHDGRLSAFEYTNANSMSFMSGFGSNPSRSWICQTRGI